MTAKLIGSGTLLSQAGMDDAAGMCNCQQPDQPREEERNVPSVMARLGQISPLVLAGLCQSQPPAQGCEIPAQ